MAWGSPYVDYVDVLVWLRILHRTAGPNLDPPILTIHPRHTVLIADACPNISGDRSEYPKLSQKFNVPTCYPNKYSYQRTLKQPPKACMRTPSDKNPALLSQRNSLAPS